MNSSLEKHRSAPKKGDTSWTNAFCSLMLLLWLIRMVSKVSSIVRELHDSTWIDSATAKYLILYFPKARWNSIFTMSRIHDFLTWGSTTEMSFIGLLLRLVNIGFCRIVNNSSNEFCNCTSRLFNLGFACKSNKRGQLDYNCRWNGQSQGATEMPWAFALASAAFNLNPSECSNKSEPGLNKNALRVANFRRKMVTPESLVFGES